MAIQNGRSKMCFYRFSMGDRELAIQTSSKYRICGLSLSWLLNSIFWPRLGSRMLTTAYDELLTGLVLIEVKII